MNGYEKLIKVISELVDSSPMIAQTTMNGPTSCNFNDLQLDEDDLLIAEHLRTGYVKKVTQTNGVIETEYAEPLKKGDIVIIMRVSDDKFAILERMV